MNIADLTNPDTNPLPEEVKDLVAALIEGRVRSMFLVAEIEDSDSDTSWIEGYSVHMDEHESDIRAFVGAVTLNLDELKQDIVGGEFTINIEGMDDDADE